MVPRCKGCVFEHFTSSAAQKYYYCNHKKAQVRRGGELKPRKMIAGDHGTSPPWCPKRRERKDRGRGKCNS